MKEGLVIVYKIESGIDRQLDGDLVAAALGCGWAQAWDRGFNCESGERTLSFDRGEAHKLIRTPLVAFELDTFCDQEPRLCADCEEVADLPE